MNKIITLLFVLTILYGIYNAQKPKESVSINQTKESETSYRTHAKIHKQSHFEEELSRVDTEAYIKHYIVSIINHGSYELGFKGGVMEGGYASKEDAPKIACYVLSLSGRSCRKPYPKNAEMFFTSICGGCHGNDGKGLGGNYPDLTRKKLLGIERREAFLKEQISQMHNNSK